MVLQQHPARFVEVSTVPVTQDGLRRFFVHVPLSKIRVYLTSSHTVLSLLFQPFE
jgi:hypothetical protein